MLSGLPQVTERADIVVACVIIPQWSGLFGSRLAVPGQWPSAEATALSLGSPHCTETDDRREPGQRMVRLPSSSHGRHTRAMVSPAVSC